jgi:hypothetical protein
LIVLGAAIEAAGSAKPKIATKIVVGKDRKSLSS